METELKLDGIYVRGVSHFSRGSLLKLDPRFLSTDRASPPPPPPPSLFTPFFFFNKNTEAPARGYLAPTSCNEFIYYGKPLERGMLLITLTD